MKVQYETSTARLCQLILKFGGCKKHQNHTMRQHLTVMSNMISELRAAGHDMTDEQQIQAVIRSLPSSWEHMLLTLPTMTTSRLLMMLLIMLSSKKIIFLLKG